MLGTLTDKFQDIFRKISGKGTLSEANMTEAVSQVRLALLEADVNYQVAKALVKRLKEKALGTEVLKSVSPSQQFIKIVHDELAALMGGDEAVLDLKGSPAVIMMCGLQGAGKTTQTAKIARYLLKKNLAKAPLLAACDLQRPAAALQLKVLGEKVGAKVFSLEGETSPLKVAEAALQFAAKNGHDVLLVDTAGRLHIDEGLMQELTEMKNLLHPSEILFVANAATGQDAVKVASEFNSRLEVSGSILTMLDGNTRGGAAISIREVTGKPLKFEGIGEGMDDFQLFSPSSMADRILGMGDTINLVRKVEEHMSESDAQQMEKKIRSASFTYEDYLKQIRTVRQMGSLKSLMGMIPGMSKMKDMDLDERELFKVEAIILSMTPRERGARDQLVPTRRRRIASGSGTTIHDVNRLVKSFSQAVKMFGNQKLMKKMKKKTMHGGKLWR